MKIICILFLLTNILYIISGEYFIKDHVPSFLYHKFNNFEYEIFPYVIKLNVSLSRIIGDLLYSIDKNGNQLIVSLSDEMEPIIKIEFRKERKLVSLKKLCGCERCLYEILYLRISIISEISLQCNDREVEYFKYNIKKEVNEAYQLPYSKNDTNNGLPNEAHLWIVNQEQYKDVLHNQEQLLGCIFDVWNFREKIHFTKVSNNVGRKCKKICIGDICNGGKCYETYNGYPMCDCTKTFLTGTYCNDSLKSMNLRTLSTSFQFELFKISWKSSSKEILLLNNSNVEIQLCVVDKILLLKYKYTNGQDIFIKGTLSRNYIPDQKYILLIRFLNKAIHMEFFDNKSWLNIIIPTNRDLGNEIFTLLSLQSEDGYIGFYFKTSPRDYTWYKFKIRKYQEIIKVVKKSDNQTKISTYSIQKNATLYTLKDKINPGYIVSSIIAAVLGIPLLLVILVLVYILKRKATNQSNRDTITKASLINEKQILVQINPTNNTSDGEYFKQSFGKNEKLKNKKIKSTLIIDEQILVQINPTNNTSDGDTITKAPLIIDEQILVQINPTNNTSDGDYVETNNSVNTESEPSEAGVVEFEKESHKHKKLSLFDAIVGDKIFKAPLIREEQELQKKNPINDKCEEEWLEELFGEDGKMKNTNIFGETIPLSHERIVTNNTINEVSV